MNFIRNKYHVTFISSHTKIFVNFYINETVHWRDGTLERPSSSTKRWKISLTSHIQPFPSNYAIVEWHCNFPSTGSTLAMHFMWRNFHGLVPHIWSFIASMFSSVGRRKTSKRTWGRLDTSLGAYSMSESCFVQGNKLLSSNCVSHIQPGVLDRLGFPVRSLKMWLTRSCLLECLWSIGVFEIFVEKKNN